MDKKETRSCSFCHKSQQDVLKLVAGEGVYICDECVSLCNEILLEDLAASDKELAGSNPLPTPDVIKEKLDQYVIGQELAKKILSVAVYNHYKRVTFPNVFKNVELDKSNILLLGPTGSGKTLLARTLARILKVPFAMADATTLTEAGYVGADVESILSSLLSAADGDVAQAEKGILFVDEIDKIARRGENTSVTRDVSGEGVQQALLKMLEGTVCSIPPKGGRKHPDQRLIDIDTKNILFICGGAFSGLDKIIAKRKGKNAIGFNTEYKVSSSKNDSNLVMEVISEDLLKYGLIPELVGRIPVVAPFMELTSEDFKRILTEPRNAIIKQYQKLFELDSIKLTFSDESIRYIISKVEESGLGARGLKGIIEDMMLDPMFESPVDKELVEVVVGDKGKIEKVYTHEKSNKTTGAI